MATVPIGQRRRRTALRLTAFVVAACGLGAVAGIAWWGLVDLATYTVNPNGSAATTERGLTEFFAGDAWFSVLGLVLGLLLGLAAWRFFRAVGWPLVPVLLVAALGASLVCWAVGYQLGPGEFTPRLARAQPGDVVPIELTVRSTAALVVWPFVAVLPVLIGSSLGRDDEEPRAPLRRRDARRSGVGTGADVGPDRLRDGG